MDVMKGMGVGEWRAGKRYQRANVFARGEGGRAICCRGGRAENIRKRTWRTVQINADGNVYSIDGVC